MKRRRPVHRWRWWLPQIAAIAAVLLVAYLLLANLEHNLARRGISLGFAFLGEAARFPISESLIRYDSVDSVTRALVAGFLNTAMLTALVIVLSTLIGIPLALARRSHHPLARHLSAGLVALVRNSPLVVQLLFWYGLFTIALPGPQHAWQPLPGIFVTGRGFHFTSFGIVGSALPVAGLLLLGLAGTALLAWLGRLHAASVTVLLTVIAAAALWGLLGLTLASDVPRLGRFGYLGGRTITPEFAAVVTGSVIYATAFACEIIRSGIDAVPRGQWQAAQALGLSERQILRLVVVPQALRIMIPPMTNQFISALKNSTLAMVIGFPETNFVVSTAINHTGQALEGVAILMLVFAALTGLIAFAMGRLNAAVALKGRA